MGQYVLLLVVALTVGAVVFGVTVLVSGGDPGLEPAEPDGLAVPLPGSRPLAEADVAGVRFDTAVRGYRMAQVDQALNRAAYDIGYKDELIGVLEAEVIALREGRTGDADVLRRAREAALVPAGGDGIDAADPAVVGAATAYEEADMVDEPAPPVKRDPDRPRTGPLGAGEPAAAEDEPAAPEPTAVDTRPEDEIAPETGVDVPPAESGGRPVDAPAPLTPADPADQKATDPAGTGATGDAAADGDRTAPVAGDTDVNTDPLDRDAAGTDPAPSAASESGAERR